MLIPYFNTYYYQISYFLGHSGVVGDDMSYALFNTGPPSPNTFTYGQSSTVDPNQFSISIRDIGYGL